MNSVLLILVFSCVLFQFGSDAAFTLQQIQDISALSRPSLEKFTIPDLIEQDMLFKPSYEIPRSGAAEEYPSTISLMNGTIEGFNTYRVDDEEVAYDLENSERFNITLRIKKASYQFDYKVSSILSNAGNIAGELFDIKIIIPVDTTNNVVTVVGPVHCEMWGPKLTFTKGPRFLDIMFNDNYYLFYEYARELLGRYYFAYCVAEVIKSVNAAVPEVMGNE